MSIIIDAEKQLFRLQTVNTEYVFKIINDRYLAHCYYGVIREDIPSYIKIPFSGFSSHSGKMENDYPIVTDNDWEYEIFSLTDDFSEFSFFGSGDYRCCSLRLRNKNGDSCTHFVYNHFQIFMGRANIPGLPFARAQEDSETLAVYLTDTVTECELVLYYTIFPSCDVISRYFSLSNKGSSSVKIEKAMSICLDLPGHEYEMVSLYGRHYFERNIQKTPLFYGNQRIMSRRGASSHQFNPFMALTSKNATEEVGDVYAFNLVFSGCFLDEVEVDQHGNTRVGIGLGDENFSYTVAPGEFFASPEAVMIYSSQGMGNMSRKMHAFIRKAILPPEPFEKRPVVLNSWEAVHFDIDQPLLVKFAKEAARCDIDMLVMDDGWFGQRNTDHAGLGDWYANPQKFPNGLSQFVSEIKKQGVKFGIWIEPEMVNPDSNLYRNHPDWCLVCKDREPSLSRNQLVLDLCNSDVLMYLKESFKKVFDGVDIDYIKWDFNRHLSEVGSKYLPADRQDEVFYRYQLGVYDLYTWFRKTYPHLMIENCSGGGGRYDLGMMALSNQIWTSDNTFAKSRVYIQYGTSLAYPASTMSCHVSDPGKENTLAELDYKFKVALGGMLGYELNILEQPEAVKTQIKTQIELYRQVEELIKCGDLYRLLSPFDHEGGTSAYYYTDPHCPQNRILLSFLQNVGPHYPTTYRLPIRVADVTARYRDAISGQEYSGTQLREGLLIETSVQDKTGRLFLLEKQS